MKPRKLIPDQNQNNVSHFHHHRHHNQSHHLKLSPPSKKPEAKKEAPIGFEPNTPFESSMGTTFMILLSALFFMGFFSLYLRRCAKSPPSDPPDPASPTRQPPKPDETSSTVGSRPLIFYGGDEEDRDRDCVICLNELKDGETVRVVSCCGHVFHPGCVDTWLLTHLSCPLCRSTNVFGAEEEGSGVIETGEDLNGQIGFEEESTPEI